MAFGKGGLNHLLKNRSYIGEIVHGGQIYAADHEPILDRALFDAVQARLAANNVEKKRHAGSSPYLLTGLIFDSAGNRMTPSHCRKQGVRYRYYISQALILRREKEAGQVARVPAPEVEALVWTAAAARLASPGALPNREFLEAGVQRVTILPAYIEVAFRPAQKPENRDFGPPQPPETVRLSWVRKPAVASKGMIEPVTAERGASGPKAQDAPAAIGKARLWVREILAGGSFAAIAKREGKGERQIRLLLPLAFVPPRTVRELIAGTASINGVTELAKSVPLVWP